MKFNYILGDEWFEYESDYYDTQKEIKKQLSYMNKDQLIDYIMNSVSDDNIEEDFYQELKDAFEDVARESYMSWKESQELEDYMINNRE